MTLPWFSVLLPSPSVFQSGICRVRTVWLERGWCSTSQPIHTLQWFTRAEEVRSISFATRCIILLIIWVMIIISCDLNPYSLFVVNGDVIITRHNCHYFSPVRVHPSPATLLPSFMIHQPSPATIHLPPFIHPFISHCGSPPIIQR